MVVPAPADSQEIGSTDSTNGWFNPQWYKPLGQCFELLSVIVLVAPIGMFWWSLQAYQKVLIYGVAVVVALICLTAACLFSLWAERASRVAGESSEQIINSRKHIISNSRLLVLKEQKVARDAFEVLRRLIHSTLRFDDVDWPLVANHPQSDDKSAESVLTAEDLIGELQRSLGKERTNEVKDEILKYTVYDVEFPQKPIDSANTQLKPPSQERIVTDTASVS